jgi:hypothetical protein
MALRNATLSTIPVFARPSPAPEISRPFRTRGFKGRAEAATRGVITGNGPYGGILNSAKNVVMWGFPGKMLPLGVKDFLKRFSLDNSREEIVKVEK